jgi:MscS family membrane protein
MNFRRAVIGTSLLVLSVMIVFSACTGSGSILEQPSPLPAGTVTAEHEDREVTATSGAEGISATLEVEDIGPIIASRTPIATATPGQIGLVIEQFGNQLGLDEITFLGLSVSNWMNLALSTVIGILIYYLGMWIIRKILRHLVARTPTEIDDLILSHVDDQLNWLVIIMAIQIAILRLQFVGVDVKRIVQDVAFLGYLVTFFIIAWKGTNFALNLLAGRLDDRMERSQSSTLMQLIGWLVKFLLLFIFVTVLLDYFGINITGITAVLGLGGLALSLAAQDTIADFISGIIILLDQPFRIGDRIEIDRINTWGDVMEIGIRTTKIRTRDNRLVIVPNSTIGNSSVVNYTFPDPAYRVQVELGIGFGQDIDEIRRIIIEAVRKVEGVLPDKPVDALFLEFGDTALRFRVRWWIHSYVDTRRMFDKVNQKMFDALSEAGIEMPFTTYDVNIRIDNENAQRLSGVVRDSSKTGRESGE